MTLMEMAQLLGNLGEFIGALAVVVTLGYLVTQVRHAKHELLLGRRQARADATRELLHHLSEIAPICAKLDWPSYGDWDLNAEENVKFGAWCHGWMRTQEMNFRVMEEKEERDTLDQLLQFLLSNRWGAKFWEAQRGLYDDKFKAYVDGILAQLHDYPKSPEDLMAGR